MNFLSVFDHFVWVALKGLIYAQEQTSLWKTESMRIITAYKVSIFRVILVRIFPNSD